MEKFTLDHLLVKQCTQGLIKYQVVSLMEFPIKGSQPQILGPSLYMLDYLYFPRSPPSHEKMPSTVQIGEIVNRILKK